MASHSVWLAEQATVSLGLRKTSLAGAVSDVSIAVSVPMSESATTSRECLATRDVAFTGRLFIFSAGGLSPAVCRRSSVSLLLSTAGYV